MFLFISKLIPIFVYPLGLASVFLILALWLRKRRRWQRNLLILALLLIWLGGNRYVSATLVRSLEWRYLPLAPIPEAAAIVILGGG
ncbi:MAG: YdcF family protein, partial [Anaerolineales bacterium]